jgi:hypothetical protein
MVEVSLLIEYTLVGYCKLTGLPCPNETHIDKFTEDLFAKAQSDDTMPGAIGVNDCEYAYQLSRCLACMPFTKQVLKMESAKTWMHLDTLKVEESPTLSPPAKTAIDIESEKEIAAFVNETAANTAEEVSLAELEAEVYQTGPLTAEASALSAPTQDEEQPAIQASEVEEFPASAAEEAPASALVSPKDMAMLRRDYQMSAAAISSTSDVFSMEAESSGDQSAPPASPNSVAAAGVVDANPKDKAMLRRQYQLTA